MSKYNPALKNYYSKKDAICIKNGVIVRQWEDREKKESFSLLIVPLYLVPDVLKNVHDEFGHFGLSKTFDSISNKYYWFGRYKEVNTYVKTCKICNLRKIPQIKGPLQQMFAIYFNKRVSIDVKQRL